MYCLRGFVEDDCGKFSAGRRFRLPALGDSWEIPLGSGDSGCSRRFRLRRFRF